MTIRSTLLEETHQLLRDNTITHLTKALYSYFFLSTSTLILSHPHILSFSLSPLSISLALSFSICNYQGLWLKYLEMHEKEMKC